ncbi:MAG TPA: C4-dicarboxylic acid transporter DauA [Gemmatimonadales bacterium]|nr:C4-dicarboxylic acid transporter DauA [Gemmatimonadales bacterium]
MPQRHARLEAPAPAGMGRWVRPAAALRESLAGGFGRAELRRDVLAGLVVGVVALPLSMALAIASGVPPQYGLYTAIVAGALIPLLGGSRTQVSGPTAAFVVLLAPVSARYGLAGLLLATLLAGALQVAFAALRMGQLIEFIPHPVTTGFTSGIAVVIASIQLADVLGLRLPPIEDTPQRLVEVVRALPGWQWPELATALLTLLLLVTWPRVTRRVPSPLVALVVAAGAAWLASRWLPGFGVSTIGDRFTFDAGGGAVGRGIPGRPPTFALPWTMPGPDGSPLVPSLGLLRDLLPPAFAIAMLGAIESLLSAVVADGMAGTRHDPDAELLGQGLGNLAAPWFGGFAATGAIARTATNVRAGGRSPVAAVTHALFVLLAMLALAPLLAHLPMAALAALLLLVAWNMAEVENVAHILQVAPRSDALVLATCMLLTILFDMVVAVTAGVLLAALLFMRRMAEISGARLLQEGAPTPHGAVPAGVLLYEIAGPLFFGAAQKAMRSLHEIEGTMKVVVLDLGAVPALDATGLVGLESAVERLQKDHRQVVLTRVQPQPLEVLSRVNLDEKHAGVHFAPTLDAALELAGRLAA